MIFVYLVLAMTNSQHRVNLLVWVIAASIGFYGIRGGIFAIVSGGQHRVWGPENSFIYNNNAIGLALLMVLPLMRYLQLQASKLWIKLGFVAAMGLTSLAVVATYSRGAFVAGVAVIVYMSMKSARHVMFLTLIAVGMLVAVQFMPEKWSDRMYSILNYETDSSAQGRFDSWTLAWRIARDRPLVGGGFDAFESGPVWRQYGSDLDSFKRAAHSIYFEVLGEHGMVGFALFMSIWFLAWRTCGRAIKRAKGIKDLACTVDLARMLQVSLVAFAVGGTFLNKALFDLYYMYLAIIVVLDQCVSLYLAEEKEAVGADHAAGDGVPAMASRA